MLTIVTNVSGRSVNRTRQPCQPVKLTIPIRPPPECPRFPNPPAVIQISLEGTQAILEEEQRPMGLGPRDHGHPSLRKQFPHYEVESTAEN